MGVTEFASFPNSIIYDQHLTGELSLKTISHPTSPTITLSSDPRRLKGGGLFTLEGGIANRNGAVYTPGGKLVVSAAGIYEFVGERLRAQPPRLKPRFLHVTEPVAALSAPEFNYFHWMYEVLPKIHLLQESGRGDVLLYLNISTTVQRQTLHLLGIEDNRILNAADHYFVTAPELLVPNFPARIGMCTVVNRTRSDGIEELTMGNLGAAVGVADWICAYLRECFLNVECGSGRARSRLYISRRDAAKGRGVRDREINELIQELGFQTIQLSGMPFAEQVHLFRNADVIVAPHGAGLTNLTFCKPGAKCLELFSPRYISDLYAVVSHLVGVDYYYLVGPTKGKVNASRSNQDVELEREQLEALFRLAEVASR
jgi:hypothetical protein